MVDGLYFLIKGKILIKTQLGNVDVNVELFALLEEEILDIILVSLVGAYIVKISLSEIQNMA